MANNFSIISLGGSLIYPEGGIDTAFLKDFKDLILTFVDKGDRFIIVAGGGSICRHYQKAANDIGPLEPEDIDWLGIHATHLNAQLVRTIFRGYAHLKIITHFTEKEEVTEPIAIAAGWRPGHSTDYDAVMLAKVYGSGTVVNLSNIEAVFDKDPKEFSDAKPFDQINWPQFRKLVGDTWQPGLSRPFDPIASKEAESSNLRVVIMNGKNLENLKNFLEGKEFVGTLIS